MLMPQNWQKNMAWILSTLLTVVEKTMPYCAVLPVMLLHNSTETTKTISSKAYGQLGFSVMNIVMSTFTYMGNPFNQSFRLLLTLIDGQLHSLSPLRKISCQSLELRIVLNDRFNIVKCRQQIGQIST